MKVIFLIGVSGSGKSTFREKFLKDSPDYILINRDNIRKSLFGDKFNENNYYQSNILNKNEEIVTVIQNKIIETGILFNKNLIIDNTNLKERDIESIINLLPVNCGILFGLFETGDIEINKERVLKRDFKELTQEEKINKTKYIDKQYNQYKNIKNYLARKKYRNNIITE